MMEPTAQPSASRLCSKCKIRPPRSRFQRWCLVCHNASEHIRRGVIKRSLSRAISRIKAITGRPLPWDETTQQEIRDLAVGARADLEKVRGKRA